jgi:hypothetical protein
VSETGHIESIVIALMSMAMKIVFGGPIWSQENPETSRPMAVEKLKPASRAAPVLDGSPREWVYRGRKKAGTKSAKVATEPAKNTMRKEKSRNKRHSMKDADLIGYRSLITHAAGKPTARVMNPSIRNAQGTPKPRIIASSPRLSAAPPMPPPALISP